MAVEQIAIAHAERQVAIARRAAAEAVKVWQRVDVGSIAKSWRALLPSLLAVVGTSQAVAAASAGVYADDVLDAYGLEDKAAGRISTKAFAGIASDGRPLDGLLYRPAITALQQIGQGAGVERALASGRFTLDMIVRTQIADAGRTAVGAAITARPQLTGYVRMIVGKTCSRCLILAGRRYEWNQGFRRHPRCFPAGVLVSGPRSEAATRRIYQGELVVLATASGQKLALTGNHPVLTGRGWVPANLLQEGDQVVRSTRPQGAAALVVPDHHQVPSRIEDVWGSLGVPVFDAVESSPEDFHGDGQHGKVDVVRADRAFDDRLRAALLEHGPECDLSGTSRSPVALDGQGAAKLLDLTDAAFASRPVGFDGLGLSLLGSLSLSAHQPSLTAVPKIHTRFGEDPGDRSARGAVLLRETVLAGSAQVGLDDFVDRQSQQLPRWDAPGNSFSVQTRDGYAARGLDLLQRLAGQVELDGLVEVRRVQWSGHVYSLTSSEGWHSANSLIVSNCDCRHIPVAEDVPGDLRTDPRAYFDSLDEAEQDQLLGKAGAQAVRQGADMAKVVNARRGMFEASGKKFTTEAAGRRPRLMPEQVLAEAKGDRAEAIRLLKLHGYIT